MLIGKTFGHLEQSCFLKENYSIKEGMPPEVNLLNEKKFFFMQENKRLNKIKEKPIKPNSPKNSIKSECACDA